MRETETSAPSLGDGTKIVPLMPTEAMWGGLARQIVMWHRFTQPTGAKLYRHLKACGWPIPAWLETEIPDRDHVPPKGSVAVAIYHAMLAAAPPAAMAEAVASARAEGWQPIETAPKDGTPILGYGAGNSRYPDEEEARQTRWRFYGEGSIAHAEFLKGKGPSGSWEWSEPQNNWGASWKPTHWMPLPAPPTLIPGGSSDV